MSRWMAAGLALAAGILAGCSDAPGFEVGDCVRVDRGVIDSDLEPADCASAVGTFDPSERVYRVDSIIQSTDGGCPSLRGFFPVEFVHEPGGVTYCLVQQD